MLLRCRASASPEAILQRLRQVPMIERRIRLDAAREQLVDEPVVKIETLSVRGARTSGKNARPGDGEAIGFGAQRLHQLAIVLVAVIMIVSDVAIAAIFDGALPMRETVPDRRPPSVFVHGPFDLIGGGRRAPDEAAGKARPAPGLPWRAPPVRGLRRRRRPERSPCCKPGKIAPRDPVQHHVFTSRAGASRKR